MRQMMGFALIGIGAVFVLATYGGVEIGLDKLWPAFLLLPAIGCHIFFFMKPSRERAGILVPGGILLVYTPLFFFSELFFDGDMSKTWPIFLLGPALGLTELYVFGGRKHALLIPIMILTAVAFIFLASNILTTQVAGILGVIFIALGIPLLSGKKKDDYST